MYLPGRLHEELLEKEQRQFKFFCLKRNSVAVEETMPNEKHGVTDLN